MHHPTRRELIGGGIVASAAALGAAGGLADASGAQIGGVLDGASGDRELIQRLTEIERLIGFAYAHVLKTGALSVGAAASVQGFLFHERAHIGLLSTELRRLGGTLPPAPSDLPAVSRQLAGLNVPGSLRRIQDEPAAVRYLIGVETLAEGAYYEAMSKLSRSRLLVLAARVMGCEAQHWTALSGMLHAGDVYRAVPYPVVAG